jgi:Cof subfamily protein (haloacid dehalogenase superfamily)
VPIRLLAIDLDGTLLNHALVINPKDAAAVESARAAGVEVVLATGRMFRSALPYARELHLDGPIINYQGALVRVIRTGEVVFRCELDLETQRKVLAIAEPKGWHVNVYVDEEVYTAEARPEAELYAEVSGVPYHVVGRLSDWVHQPATKMVLVDLNPDEVPARMSVLQEGLGNQGRVTRSLDWFVEVVNPEVSKSSALAKVAQRMGITQEEVCAIGDNVNDLDMIQWAGLGAAMGSAPQSVREVARYVTAETPDEGGVAQVIDRFILAGEAVPS